MNGLGTRRDERETGRPCGVRQPRTPPPKAITLRATARSRGHAARMRSLGRATPTSGTPLMDVVRNTCMMCASPLMSRRAVNAPTQREAAVRGRERDRRPAPSRLCQKGLCGSSSRLSRPRPAPAAFHSFAISITNLPLPPIITCRQSQLPAPCLAGVAEGKDCSV